MMTTDTLDMTMMNHASHAADEASARFWDGMARKYAKGKIADRAGYERSLARTRDYLSADSVALELGCGTGNTALTHAPYVKHITGTDISAEMVAIANEKRGENDQSNADFIVSGAEVLPFSRDSYDVVMGHNLYHLVADVDAALAEARRVTKPGGVFITKTPCLGEMGALMRRVVLPVMKRWYGVPVVHTFTIKQFTNAIEDAGFKIEAIEFHGTKGKDTRPFVVARKV